MSAIARTDEIKCCYTYRAIFRYMSYEERCELEERKGNHPEENMAAG